ncbi:hypothetical protein Mapa_000614 [Marchantia paleacea]|nr:hypothetical protein Mapa_000614 [Marchantia paleacea]
MMFGLSLQREVHDLLPRESCSHRAASCSPCPPLERDRQHVRLLRSGVSPSFALQGKLEPFGNSITYIFWNVTANEV